jgi:hypothetical protein
MEQRTDDGVGVKGKARVQSREPINRPHKSTRLLVRFPWHGSPSLAGPASPHRFTEALLSLSVPAVCLLDHDCIDLLPRLPLKAQLGGARHIIIGRASHPLLRLEQSEFTAGPLSPAGEIARNLLFVLVDQRWKNRKPPSEVRGQFC